MLTLVPASVEHPTSPRHPARPGLGCHSHQEWLSHDPTQEDSSILVCEDEGAGGGLEPPAILASGVSPQNDVVTSTEALVHGGGSAWLLAVEEL